MLLIINQSNFIIMTSNNGNTPHYPLTAKQIATAQSIIKVALARQEGEKRLVDAVEGEINRRIDWRHRVNFGNQDPIEHNINEEQVRVRNLERGKAISAILGENNPENKGVLLEGFDISELRSSIADSIRREQFGEMNEEEALEYAMKKAADGMDSLENKGQTYQAFLDALSAQQRESVSR